MVRFPDGRDRFVDELLLLLGPRTRREEVPDAAAEIGARQHAIRDEREEHRAGGNVRERHVASRN